MPKIIKGPHPYVSFDDVSVNTAYTIYKGYDILGIDRPHNWFVKDLQPELYEWLQENIPDASSSVNLLSEDEYTPLWIICPNEAAAVQLMLAWSDRLAA